ncbi:MAG: SDR family oxidoreductase [Candidatus Omnitrophica bacterium]|nr:SDR family oxidoreductase [Candidatus Omnitrophota bacterium]
MIKSLKGKIALVTGGAKRIGKAISLALAEEGVNVIVHYSLSSVEAADICAQIAGRGLKAWTINADFENPYEYETLIKRAMALTGHLDILINNASIFSTDTIDDIDFTTLSRHVGINAWVPFLLMREFAHLTQGSVVNILDTRIKGYDWKHVSYILSKHLLFDLIKMSAQKFAPAVSVNAVAPGLILPPIGKDESYLDHLAQNLPLNRHGELEDITAAVLYLLKNDFMTGQVLFLDGGRHLLEEENGQNFDQGSDRALYSGRERRRTARETGSRDQPHNRD